MSGDERMARLAEIDRLTAEDALYGLGRAVALIEGRHDRIPHRDLQVILVRPMEGLGLLTRRIAALSEERSELLGRVIDMIPTPPTGPMPMERQSAFWSGYHAQRSLRVTRLAPEELEAAGTTLYGERWQSDLARDLNINPRRVREMMERRSVPAWVLPELYRIIRTRESAMAGLSESLLRDPPEE